MNGTKAPWWVAFDSLPLQCCAGLRELVDVEPRFEPYTRSLFGAATLALDRDQRSAEENARLDALLTGFLQLFSGFFLSPGATKALEFLIRQYRCVLVLGSMGLFCVHDLL